MDIPFCYINELGDIKATNDLFDNVINDRNIINVIEFNDHSWESTMSYTYLLQEIKLNKSIEAFKGHKLIDLPLKNKKYNIQLTEYNDIKGILCTLIPVDREIEFNNKFELPDHILHRLDRIKAATIDDSISSCKILKFCIGHFGIECDSYSSTSKLINSPRRKYDFIICDIYIPGDITGIEFCQNYKSSFPGTKFFASSIDYSDALINQVRQAGFENFIPKPITVDKIRSILASM